MSKISKTDWNQLDKMKEEKIDYSDIAELDEAFFKNAEVRMPAKQSVTIRLDSDVLTWFKEQGKGYQSRINKLLRIYMDAHKT
jgi:uncharacterized protein (DUF4415 family)